MSRGFFPLFASAIDDLGLVYGEDASVAKQLQNFLRIRSSEHRPLLGDFASPSQKLHAIRSFFIENSLLNPIAISVFGPNDAIDWESARIEDAARMNALQSSMSDQVEINTYCIEHPSHLATETLFDDLRGFSTVNVQVQISDAEMIRDAVALAPDREWISLALDYSKSEGARDVAQMITECSGLEVPYQIHGLSGALFTRDGKLGTFNVLAAATLSFTEELSAKETLQILENPDLSSYDVADDGFRFGQTSVTTEKVDEAKGIFWGVGVIDVNLLFREIKSSEIL